MRSETETGREVDRNESGFVKCKSDVPVENCPTIEQLEALDKTLFGSQSDSTGLEWVRVKPDNQMIRSLKQMTSLMVHIVEKEVKTTKKQIKAAGKVFYG